MSEQQAHEASALALTDEQKSVVDKIVETLTMLAAFTWTPLDDMALRFFAWVRSQPEFLDWFKKLRTPKPETGSFTASLDAAQAAPLEALFDKWKGTLPEGTAPTGSFSEILAIIFQVIAWIKARQTKGAPTPA